MGRKKNEMEAFVADLHDIMDGSGTMKDTEIAEAFVNKGWRKQSKDVSDTNVGCEFCDDEYARDNWVFYIPTDDGASIDPPVRYCPFCGRRILEEEQT
jgi:hypothetical protein